MLTLRRAFMAVEIANVIVAILWFARSASSGGSLEWPIMCTTVAIYANGLRRGLGERRR